MKRSSAQKVILGALVVLCGGIWSAVFAIAPLTAQGHSGVLTFAVLDIGQGDALYIEGPTGVQVLVDAGNHDGKVLQALPQVMPLGDTMLDAVVETHPDADHMGGFVDVLQRYSVGAFIEPGVTKTNATIAALDKEIEEQHIARITARRGMSLDLGGGAQLEVLYPDYDVSILPAEKSNEGGIVARLSYGATSVLLTADVGSGVEARLLQLDGANLQSDVLKVAHHGSKYSSSDAFVAEVNPQVAIISVGANNTYGHPTQRVLDTLAEYDIEVLRTDQEGTVVCTSNKLEFVCN